MKSDQSSAGTAMSQLVTLPSTATIDEVATVIERDGGVIVEDMLSSETLQGFWDDVGPYLSRTPYGEGGFTGAKTRRCSALMAKSMHTAAMLTQSHFLGAAKKLLIKPYDWRMGDETATVEATLQLSVTQAIQIWPGQPAQVLHRDDGLHHRQHPGEEIQLQVLYAATDFTEENGATLVVPGSHKWDDYRRPQLEEAVPAIMKKGSGLIYYGSVYHGGGANSATEATRTAIAISLIPGYLRQEENQYLVIPKDIVKRYSKEVQALIGYSISPPFCGWVEMQDPSIVLSTEDFSVGSAQNLH